MFKDSYDEFKESDTDGSPIDVGNLNPTLHGGWSL